MVSLDWCAGFFEGEGSAVLHNDKRRPNCRSLHLTIAQVYREPLDAFCEAVGAGSVNGPYGPYGTNKQPYYQWQVTGRAALPVAKMLIPLMFRKGQQVEDVMHDYEDYLYE